MPEKIFLILENRGKHSLKVMESENPNVEVSCSYLQKCGIFIFCQKTDQGCVFFLFFFRGDSIDPAVLEYCRRAHSNGKLKVLASEEMEGA